LPKLFGKDIHLVSPMTKKCPVCSKRMGDDYAVILLGRGSPKTGEVAYEEAHICGRCATKIEEDNVRFQEDLNDFSQPGRQETSSGAVRLDQVDYGDQDPADDLGK